MTYSPLCHVCKGQAIVVQEILGNSLCLTHALEAKCRCGHNAARCPILGCGDWGPIDPVSYSLLELDFFQSADPDQHPIH